MAVFDQLGNEITLAEMASQMRDFLAADAEHRPDEVRCRECGKVRATTPFGSPCECGSDNWDAVS